MVIKELKEVTEEVLVAFEKLMSQLAPDLRPTVERLNTIMQSDHVLLFVAEENNVIIGTISLVLYDIPSGQKVWIEDVVVDNAIRGKGIGRKLVQHAIDCAKAMGVKKVDLTTSFDRVAANALYQDMGFVKRESNVYRLWFE